MTTTKVHTAADLLVIQVFGYIKQNCANDQLLAAFFSRKNLKKYFFRWNEFLCWCWLSHFDLIHLDDQRSSACQRLKIYPRLINKIFVFDLIRNSESKNWFKSFLQRNRVTFFLSEYYQTFRFWRKGKLIPIRSIRLVNIFERNKNLNSRRMTKHISWLQEEDSKSREYGQSPQFLLIFHFFHLSKCKFHRNKFRQFGEFQTCNTQNTT